MSTTDKLPIAPALPASKHKLLILNILHTLKPYINLLSPISGYLIKLVATPMTLLNGYNLPFTRQL